MQPELLLGIDVGTYSAKGVLVQPDGKVLAAHTVEYELKLPRPGYAEHDADADWWNSVVEICQALLAQTKVDPRQIAGIGCSAIGPAVLPVDDQGKPLRPAILYGIDTRSVQEIADLNEQLGPERIYELTGRNLSAQSAGPKILWVRKHEPDIFACTHKFMSASGYLTFKLTNRYTIDTSLAVAFSPLFDIEAQRWDPEACAAICDPELLPEPIWATDIAGEVTAEAAAATGLAKGTPVITGLVDAAAESISVGVTHPGETMLMYGTTLFIIQAVDELKRIPKLWPGTYCLKDTYSLSAGMSTGAALTRWFRDNFGQAEQEAQRRLGIDAYQLLAEGSADVPPGSNGLVVLPYFAGERSPIHDPRARGVMAGLTLSHTKQDIYRALLEGVGYGVRHNLQTMEEGGAPPQRLLAVGGGAKNALWLQIVSDILGRPQEVAATTIGAAYGDAYLAGYGVGLFRDFSVLHDSWVNIEQVVDPRMDVHHRYNDYYTVYRECYHQLQDQLHTLADLGDRAGRG